jgi:hypothetical protein
MRNNFRLIIIALAVMLSFIFIISVVESARTSIVNIFYAITSPVLRPIIIKLSQNSRIMSGSQSEQVLIQKNSVHDFLSLNLDYLQKRRNDFYRSAVKTPILREEFASELGVLSKSLCSGKSKIIIEKLKIVNNINEYYQLKLINCTDSKSKLIMGGLLAIPRVPTTVKVPMIILLHGTATSPEGLFRATNIDLNYDVIPYHNNIGDSLLNNGFAVFAPYLFTDVMLMPVSGYNETRNELAMRLAPFGLTLYGVEVRLISEAITSINENVTFNKLIDFDEIGLYGISMGGELGLYLTAYDPRIKASVISQWFENRDDKIAGDHKQANWRYQNSSHVYNKGFALKFSDEEILKYFILPRSVFIEQGSNDGHRATSSLNEYKNLILKYNEYVSMKHLCYQQSNKGHEVVFSNALFFLNYHLKKRVPKNQFDCVSLLNQE